MVLKQGLPKMTTALATASSVYNLALWLLCDPILRRLQSLRKFGEAVAVRLSKLLLGQIFRSGKIRAADIGLCQVDPQQPRAYQICTAQIRMPQIRATQIGQNQIGF